MRHGLPAVALAARIVVAAGRPAASGSPTEFTSYGGMEAIAMVVASFGRPSASIRPTELASYREWER